MRYVLGGVGWALFWVLAILGAAAAVLEWQLIERMFGL